MPTVLEARGLNKSFGAVRGASDINVAIEDGAVVGVIGANGAGKTTFVNIVTGYIKPDTGSILFKGRDITHLGPKDTTAAGICRSFQIPQLFRSVSVFDNLLTAMAIAESRGMPMWQPIAQPDRLARCAATLARFQIDGYSDQPAETLPQGVRKLLDIAMATVHSPEVLMLDEPTSGIAAREKFQIMDIVIGALRDQKVTVLFIEHDMEVVARYAGRVLAFYDGRVIADGPPDAVLADPQVRRYVIGDTLHGDAG